MYVYAEFLFINTGFLCMFMQSSSEYLNIQAKFLSIFMQSTSLLVQDS